MSDSRSIYLDHAATTPLDPRVFEAMLPYLREEYGNASSPHGPGRRARFAVEDARERIAAHLGAEPGEIVFTSGGTEANNLALWALSRQTGGTLAAALTEHESILEPLRAINETGVDVHLANPMRNGTFPIDLLEGGAESISAVSAMHTNNETGAVNPIRQLSALCRERGVLLHSDCVQAMGWADLNVDGLGVDLMTVSAHKIYGPKGVGVLFARGGALELTPFVRGGSQERRRRGGTENVSAIVGLAAALDLAVQERADRVEHYSTLKRRLGRNIESMCSGEFIVNTPEDSAPHILNVSFPPAGGAEVDGEMLLLNLDVAGIHTSSGSACTSGAVEPSHVLLAMGVPEAAAQATIRFSVGISNTLVDMDVVTDELSRILSRMRARVA